MYIFRTNNHIGDIVMRKKEERVIRNISFRKSIIDKINLLGVNNLSKTVNDVLDMWCDYQIKKKESSNEE
jgi:hypothetical protein